MRDVIGEVVGREHGRGAFDGLVGVAGIDHRNARLAPVGGDRAMVLQHAIVVVALRRRRFRPGDLEQALGLHRRFDGLGDYADAGRQRHDLDHALDGFRRGIVDLLGLLVLHLREQHARIQHAGKLHVDAVLRRAVDLRRHVDATDIAADETELRGRLQIGLGHFRQRARHRRGLGDVAIADLAVRLLVHDHAGLGAELLGRHFPGCCRVGDQDLARLRAGKPQLLVVTGNRKASHRGELFASEQNLEDRVAVDLIVVRRLRNAHPAPVGVEIFGQQERQRCAHALAHLHHRRDDGDDIVLADRHPRIRAELCGRRCGVEARAEGDRDAESARGHQKRTARERLCVGIVQHGALPLYATL
jgi:hypothetical protein